MKHITKKTLSVLLTLLLALSIFGGLNLSAFALEASPVSFLAYNTATGEFEARTVTDYTVVDANTDLNAAGVYVVKDTVTLNTEINATGAADAEWSLILCDGAMLSVTAPVTLSGMTCRVYGQTQGSGTLKITGEPDRDNLFRNNSPFELHGGRVEIHVEAGIRKACIYNAAAFTVYGGSLLCTAPGYAAILLHAEFAVYGGLVEAEGLYSIYCNNDKNGVITLGEGMYCYTGESSSAELHDVVPITAMHYRYRTYSLKFVSEYVKITDETPPPATDKSELQAYVDEYTDDHKLASVIYPTYYAKLAPLYENAVALLESETATQGAVDTAVTLIAQDAWVEQLPLFLKGMKYLDVPKEPVLNGVYQLEPAENACGGDIIAFPDGETTFVRSGDGRTYSITGPVGVYSNGLWDTFAYIELMDYKTSADYDIRTDVGVTDSAPWGLRLTGGDGTYTNPYTFEVLIQAPWDNAGLNSAMAEAAVYYNEIKADHAAAADTLKAAIIAAKDARYDPLATQASFDAAEETLRAALTDAKNTVNAEKFAAYQAAAAAAAAEQAADGDSEAAAALIAAAVRAINSAEYDGDLTLEANEAAIDAILTDLTAGLAALREAEAQAAAAAAEDQAAAQRVEALIDAIGKVELNKACKDKIDAAEKAYNALTDAQKALVENADVLTAARAKYEKLKAQAQKEKEPVPCELCGKIHDSTTVSGFFEDLLHGLVYTFGRFFMILFYGIYVS